MAKFEKGRSGNPGGRPKISTEVTEFAKQESMKALQRIVEIARDEDENGKLRLQANIYLVDRACGRPPQSTTLDFDRDIVVSVNVR
jgi:hypothetical protein